MSGQCITRQQLEHHEMLVQHGSVSIFYLPLHGVELRGSGCATRQTYMNLKYLSGSGRVRSGWVGLGCSSILPKQCLASQEHDI